MSMVRRLLFGTAVSFVAGTAVHAQQAGFDARSALAQVAPAKVAMPATAVVQAAPEAVTAEVESLNGSIRAELRARDAKQAAAEAAYQQQRADYEARLAAQQQQVAAADAARAEFDKKNIAYAAQMTAYNMQWGPNAKPVAVAAKRPVKTRVDADDQPSGSSSVKSSKWCGVTGSMIPARVC